MNRMKRLFATFAASISLAASGLATAPASAQSGGGGDYIYYNCNDPTTGSTGGYYGSGYGCCQYDEAWGGWYIMYVTHWEPCNPYTYNSPEPDDRPSLEAREPAGQ